MNFLRGETIEKKKRLVQYCISRIPIYSHIIWVTLNCAQSKLTKNKKRGSVETHLPPPFNISSSIVHCVCVCVFKICSAQPTGRTTDQAIVKWSKKSSSSSSSSSSASSNFPLFFSELVEFVCLVYFLTFEKKNVEILAANMSVYLSGSEVSCTELLAGLSSLLLTGLNHLGTYKVERNTVPPSRPKWVNLFFGFYFWFWDHSWQN